MLMPVGGYAWLEAAKIASKDWTKFNDTDLTGYILEVDLYYPEHLHLKHNSLPLAPYKMKIDESILSPYAKACLLEIKGTEKHKSEKLVSTFLPRRNYVIHAKNLALYIELGMKLVKIHRVLSFRQSSFLKKYISYCTRKRAESTSSFRKRLFKAFSNSNFGKFIEQTRNHLDCKIVNNKKDFEKWISNPRFSNFKEIGTGFVAVFLKRKRIYMIQAWAIGFSILELSKALIYEHYYKIIKPALGNKCAVLFSDTDSLCLQIRTKLDMYEVMKHLSHIMDFSNYPKDHPLYDDTRKNQLLYWKDELASNSLLEFCGLSSKTYSMRISCESGEKTKSKCKGTGRNFMKQTAFTEYKKCIIGINTHRTLSYNIQARNHIIRTVKSDKLCFSSFDDKRFLTCPVHSLAYGSKYIRMCERAGRCLLCK